MPRSKVTVKKRHKVAPKASGDHGEAAPQQEGTLGMPMPKWGLRLARERGEMALQTSTNSEELNPGMLLADLVTKKEGKTAAPKKKKKSNKKASVGSNGPVDGKPARDENDAVADDEDGLLPYDADEDEAAAAGSGGDRLVAAIQGLGTGDGEDRSLKAILAKRRSLAKDGPESEFNAGGLAEEVTVEDLLATVSEDAGFSQVRKQLKGLAKKDKLPEPTYEAKKNREERAAQYETTRKEQGKWLPQIKRSRESDQVVLGDEKTDSAPRKISALIDTIKPADDFEKELMDITRAAGATEKDLKREAVLPVNSKLRDETSKRQVARLKAMMFREQQARKRVNRIKSKTYRRIHRKAESKEKEALMARLNVENPELAKDLKEEYEKSRAQQRLLRQRNARRKWTQAMIRYAKNDKGAQREITKQAQGAHNEQMSLRRAIKGQDPDQSDSDAVDLSGSEGEGDNTTAKGGIARETIGKARNLTVKEIKSLEQTEGELPTTGILGMNFMRDAIKRKREDAKQDAKHVLQELQDMDDKLDDIDEQDSDEEGGGKAHGKAGKKGDEAPGSQVREFTAEELAVARKEVDQMEERGEGMEVSVSGPLTVRGVAATSELPDLASGEAGGSSSSRPARRRQSGAARGKSAAAGTTKAAVQAATASGPEVAAVTSSPLVDPNPWMDATFGLDAGQGAPGGGGSGEGAKAVDNDGTGGADAAAEKKKRKQKRKHESADQPDGKALADREAGHREREAVEEITDMLSPLNADSQIAREQRDLVRTAFIEGTHLEDFDAEQDDLASKNQEAADLASGKLAGWGSWTGACIAPRRPKGVGKGKGKDKGKGKGDAADQKRQPRVQFAEGTTEASKYFVGKVPYGFQNHAQYDQQLNMPIGQEWNTLPVHLKNIKPKMFVKTGAIVPPLQHVKHLPPEQRGMAINHWGAAKAPKRLKSRM